METTDLHRGITVKSKKTGRWGIIDRVVFGGKVAMVHWDLEPPMIGMEREARSILAENIVEAHDCMDYALHYKTDGPLGDAYDCSRCGRLIQVG